jgi:hypothetical protein
MFFVCPSKEQHGPSRVVNCSSTIIWHHIAMPDEHHLILRQATENILSAVAPTRQHRIALALAQTRPEPNARELADKCFVITPYGPEPSHFDLENIHLRRVEGNNKLGYPDQEGKQIYEVIIPVADVACM